MSTSAHHRQPPLAPLASLLKTAARAVILRPHLVLLLLLVNLLSSWVLTAPLRGVLREELDHNLYGETMATEASWRWFDTVSRRHPGAVGDLSIIESFFSNEGVGLSEALDISGPAAAVALGALILFWAHSLLICGFLAHLHPDHRGGFGNAVVRFIFPASALTFFAVLTYALAYGLLYVQTGRWLAPWAESFDSQGAVLGLTSIRLGITLLTLLVLKVLFDLARVVLVDRDGWNWPWAFLIALRELLRRRGPGPLPYPRVRYPGLRYLGLGFLPLLATPLLALLWWPLGTLLAAPQGWITLSLAFLLQQIFIGARIAVRLTGIAAVNYLYQATRAVPVKPPYKVDPPPERNDEAAPR